MTKGKWRSPAILKAARDCPCCMSCGADNHGQVVAAHANWSEYGKGMGTKAHDWAVAYLCGECHLWLDTSGAPRVEKVDFWRCAHAKTLEWLFESGRLNCCS